MLHNLKVEMLIKNISNDDLSKTLNLHRNTVSNKINEKEVNGKIAYFNLNEIRLLKNNFFNNLSIDYLFNNKKENNYDNSEIN